MISLEKSVYEFMRDIYIESWVSWKYALNEEEIEKGRKVMMWLDRMDEFWNVKGKSALEGCIDEEVLKYENSP